MAKPVDSPTLCGIMRPFSPCREWFTPNYSLPQGRKFAMGTSLLQRAKPALEPVASTNACLVPWQVASRYDVKMDRMGMIRAFVPNQLLAFSFTLNPVVGRRASRGVRNLSNGGSSFTYHLDCASLASHPNGPSRPQLPGKFGRIATYLNTMASAVALVNRPFKTDAFCFAWRATGYLDRSI